nr:hypothetical protein [Tanacetum cinerariifolium]
MTTPSTTTSNSQMHINIMATGSRERPPMLATRRYAQWQLCFLIYVDTKLNKKELRQCIFDGLYNEVNDFHAEKLSRNANPLALVVATQQQHSEQPKPNNDTYVVETVDSNVIPNSSNMCANEEHGDQNAEEYEDECAVLANLIGNLKLDHDENKKILKKLKKANASLTHELNECKSALEESNDIQDRCRSEIHNQEIEHEKYKKYTNCQLKKEEVKLKHKQTLDLLAQKKLKSNEALKT